MSARDLTPRCRCHSPFSTPAVVSKPHRFGIILRPERAPSPRGRFTRAESPSPAVTDAAPHLAGLLESQFAELLERWEGRARARCAGTPELAAHLPALLRCLIADLGATGGEDGAPSSAAPRSLQAFRQPFDLEAVVHELGVLQRVVLELLEHASVPASMREVRQLGDWFTRAVAAAVVEHAQLGGGGLRSDVVETQRSAGQRPPSARPEATYGGSPGDEPVLDGVFDDDPASSEAQRASARRRIDALLAERTRADQRKDEFLAMLAHELRNPMAAISTALTLLDQTGGDAQRAQRYREAAKRQMNNLVRLVDDLLDVARLTRGQIELRRRAVDLEAVVQHALAATRGAIEARRHELTVTLAPGTFRVSGDATRLEQVIVNLLTNAAKYTEPGGSISVRLAREDGGDGPHGVLSVRDTGRGIPAEMLDLVFDLFTQVAPSIDRNTGGLGLGLTLVKHLTELHGGSASAQSAGPGQGSEFSIRLPLLAEPAARANDSHPTPTTAAAPDQRRRVVVVEDAEDVRELLKECIEQLGHEVLVAQDGLEGAALINTARPGLALVDVGLPGIDGYELARRVRQQPAGRGTILVALTGYGGADVERAAREAGFDLHVTKPIDLERLQRVLAAKASSLRRDEQR